jgi:hypothetical protein
MKSSRRSTSEDDNNNKKMKKNEKENKNPNPVKRSRNRTAEEEEEEEEETNEGKKTKKRLEKVHSTALREFENGERRRRKSEENWKKNRREQRDCVRRVSTLSERRGEEKVRVWMATGKRKKKRRRSSSSRLATLATSVSPVVCRQRGPHKVRALRCREWSVEMSAETRSRFILKRVSSVCSGVS